MGLLATTRVHISGKGSAHNHKLYYFAPSCLLTKPNCHQQFVERNATIDAFNLALWDYSNIGDHQGHAHGLE